MYEALKSLAESYDLVINCMPRGTCRSSVEGYFITAIKPAKEAIRDYEIHFLEALNLSHEQYTLDPTKHNPSTF